MTIEISENYKDLAEIRSMITVGNKFIPVIERHSKSAYLLSFQIKGNGNKYELATQKRKDRPLQVRQFKSCDSVLQQLETLGFDQAIVRFNQRQN